MRCPNCAAEISPLRDLCPHCGASTDRAFDEALQAREQQRQRSPQELLRNRRTVGIVVGGILLLMIVTGEFVRTVPDGYGSIDMRLKTNHPDLPLGIDVDGHSVDAATKLQPGQTVTVSCRAVAGTGDDPWLSDCVIQPLARDAPGSPAAPTAPAAPAAPEPAAR